MTPPTRAHGLPAALRSHSPAQPLPEGPEQPPRNSQEGDDLSRSAPWSSCGSSMRSAGAGLPRVPSWASVPLVTQAAGPPTHPTPSWLAHEPQWRTRQQPEGAPLPSLRVPRARVCPHPRPPLLPMHWQALGRPNACAPQTCTRALAPCGSQPAGAWCTNPAAPSPRSSRSRAAQRRPGYHQSSWRTQPPASQPASPPAIQPAKHRSLLAQGAWLSRPVAGGRVGTGRRLPVPVETQHNPKPRLHTPPPTHTHIPAQLIARTNISRGAPSVAIQAQKRPPPSGCGPCVVGRGALLQGAQAGFCMERRATTTRVRGGGPERRTSSRWASWRRVYKMVYI